MKNVVLILSLMLYANISFGLSQEDSGLPYGGFADAYSPGIADLPLDSTRTTDLLGIEADLRLFSLGCNSLDVEDIAGAYGEEFEQMGDYYRNNATGLGINYLIYRSPTLYQLIVENLQGFREVFDASMMTCQSVRQSGSKDRLAAEAEAVDKCVEEHGPSRLCNMKYTEYANKMTKKYRQELQNIWSKISVMDGNSGGDTNGGGSQGNASPPGGESIVNDTIARQYGISDEAKKYFDDLIPSLALKNDEDSDENKSSPTPAVRKKKLGEVLRARQIEYSKTIDNAVNKHLKGENYSDELTTIVQSPYMYKLTPDWIVELAKLKVDKRSGGLQYYTSLVRKMSRTQSIAQAQHMVSEFEMAILNMETSGQSSEAIKTFSEKFKQHYGDSIQLLKAQLAAEAELDKNYNLQLELLKSAAAYNKAKHNKSEINIVPQ